MKTHKNQTVPQSASQWLRLGAVLLDLLYSYVAELAGGYVLFHTVFDSVLAGALFSGTLYWIINWVYFLGMTGATLGKHTLGLQVVRQDGQAMDVLIAMKRSLAWVFSVFVFGFGVVPLLFSRRRLAFHDWVADTTVQTQKGGLPG